AGFLVGKLESLPTQFHPLLANLYRHEIVRRAGLARVFTNTSPGRIHDAALIAAVFPNTRFILVKRDVDDNVLRIFIDRYLRGNFYAYDLKAARDQFSWYHQMIDLRAQKLPQIARVIHYEEMVANPAAALRTAAELCGLPMTDRPLPTVGDDRGCAGPYQALL